MSSEQASESQHRPSPLEKKLRAKIIEILLRAPPAGRTKLAIANSIGMTPAEVDNHLTAIRQEGIYRPELREHHDQYIYELSIDPAPTEPFKVPPELLPDGRALFGIISNTEYGHKSHRDDALLLFYKAAERLGVKLVLHCGDILAGPPDRKNRNELLLTRADHQTMYLAKNYPRIEGIETYFITAPDCEGKFIRMHKRMVGPYIESICRDVGRTDLHYLGHGEQDVIIPVTGQNLQGKEVTKDAVVRMGHLAGRIPYAKSYPLQKAIEAIQGGTKPHVLAVGHLYHLEDFFDQAREIWGLQVGGFKDQSASMRNQRQSVSVGGVFVELGFPAAEKFQDQPFSLTCETFPLFDRHYYTRRSGTYNRRPVK